MKYRIKLTDEGIASQQNVSLDTAFSQCVNSESEQFKLLENHKRWRERNGEDSSRLPNILKPSSEVTLSTDYEFYDGDD